MKKKITLISSAILFVISGLYAQTEKGSVYLGGSVGFSSTASNNLPNDPTPKSYQTQFTVSPSLAWAYKNNRFIGFSLSYENSRLADYNLIDKQNSVAASVFLRQYKLVVKGLYLFAHESFSARFSHTDDISYNYDNYQSSVGVSPGLAYNIAKHLQLEVVMVNIVYAQESYTKYLGAGVQTDNHNNTFSFGSSLEGSPLSSLEFGLRFFP